MRWQCIGTVRRPSLLTEEQVENKEWGIGQDGLKELLGSGQMVKEFGSLLTGNGESLKDFEQVEQGKDVTC